MSTPRTLSGVTWDCSGCGACCRRSYRLGPVEPAVIEGLKRLDVAAHWPPAKDGWYTTQRAPDGQVAYFLETKEGQCVFLQDDQRCAIHARWGAEAKPGFCREFPYHLVSDPTGLVAIVRGECKGFHHSFEGTVPVEQQADAVAALPRSVPVRTFAPEEVSLFPGVSMPIDDWWALEEALLQRATEADGVDAAFASVREGLYAAADRPAPAPDPHRVRLAEEAVLRAVEMLLTRAVADPAGASPDQHRFAEEGLATVKAAIERLDAPVPDPEPDLSRYGQVLLRTLLLGRLWESSGAVAIGLGRHRLHDRLARRMAETPSAAAWSEIYVPWQQLSGIPAVQWVYGKAAPAFLDVLRAGG